MPCVCVVQIDAVNSHGCTPLHLACNHGHEGVVNTLLQHGASVNPLNDKGQVRHQCGAMWSMLQTVYTHTRDTTAAFLLRICYELLHLS